MAIPHTWQPQFACSSLKVNGKCVHCPGRVGHLGSTTLVSFWSPWWLGSLNQPKMVHGSHNLALSSATPMETHPKTSISPVGTTDPLPSSIQVILQENKSEGRHQGQPSQRPGHPQNHSQPSHWCSSWWTLLRKHCLQPRAPLGVSLCHRVPGRPPPALWHYHTSPNVIPAGWVLLFITGKVQRDCWQLFQHTLPALVGLKGKWSSGKHSKVGGSLLWEPFMPALRVPCRTQKEPLEGCRGLLCTAFPQRRRSSSSE